MTLVLHPDAWIYRTRKTGLPLPAEGKAYEVVTLDGLNGCHVRDTRTGEIVATSANPGALELTQAWAANLEEAEGAD